MITVACVQVGNYCDRGAEYVLRLRDGVARHLQQRHRFVCITDAPLSSLSQIEFIPHYPRLTGWWQKLTLFQPTLFSGRVIFFDLDTVIMGSLDRLAGYSGDFAMIRDLYVPQRFASGVMSWIAGAGDVIWEAFINGHRRDPKHRYGDGGFISDVMLRNGRRIDSLQDYEPGLYSYKVSLRRGLPSDPRVCCFHGRPRPHETSFWQGAA